MDIYSAEWSCGVYGFEHISGQGPFFNKSLWKTHGSPPLHTSTLMPPSRLFQRFINGNGSENLQTMLLQKTKWWFRGKQTVSCSWLPVASQAACRDPCWLFAENPSGLHFLSHVGHYSLSGKDGIEFLADFFLTLIRMITHQSWTIRSLFKW